MGSVVRLVLAGGFLRLDQGQTLKPRILRVQSCAHHSSFAVATPNRRGANSEYRKPQSVE